MNFSTAILWSYANILTKKRYDALRNQYASLDEVEITPELLKALGCRDETMYDAMNRIEELDRERYKSALSTRGISLITIEDAQYPSALKTISDPPVFLYYKGSLDILNQPCIGCVGTREISNYGKRVTEEFVPAFVRSGMVVVSGLAKGIDTQCALESLHSGGKTVAVVGHGLGTMYPKANEKLADRIVQEGGLILSEFPLDQHPDRHTFPARNRIIAGLSLGTVVLEAGEGSGALITADLALEYSREVFAVPGQIFDPNYIGCHKLLAQGRAQLVTSPDDVCKAIGIVASAHTEARPAYTPQDEHEQAVYSALTTMPQSASDLVEKAQVDAAIITAKLTMLELQGAAKNTGNGMWVRN